MSDDGRRVLPNLGIETPFKEISLNRQGERGAKEASMAMTSEPSRNLIRRKRSFEREVIIEEQNLNQIHAFEEKRVKFSVFWFAWCCTAVAIVGTTAALWAWFGAGIGLGVGGMLAGIAGVLATLGSHCGWF